jgi:hypothetical protein
MSHAQDTKIYDIIMCVIIKMELAYNRHTLENGLIVLRKVIPLSLCVYEIYDRHSKVHVLRQDMMSCNNVGSVATPCVGVIKPRGLKKCFCTWMWLEPFSNRLTRSECPHMRWAWFVQTECRQNFDKNFKMMDLFWRWYNDKYANHICFVTSSLLGYWAFREENFVEFLNWNFG